ncbi:MAG: oligoendopeptidase F [Syntrophomonadaceae bacterium]|nr:oligoendopeptidase F [Syntrophomonadaceae bacterium]MDD3889922.1 oligoendopeptidase F [Syntrophomonadaceae bacterium]MDD4550115.1 oligoendopeptidase F [Syntrophomonadaceae bacterium]
MASIKKRTEIENEFKWKLEDIYPEETSWENDYQQLKTLIEEVNKYQGTLGKSAGDLLQVLQLLEKIERIAEKLYVYAKMRRDEDNADSYYQTLFDRAESISIQLSSATSYIIPEITEIETNKIETFLQENQDLAVYKHFFDELLRQKEHILSQQEEKILAMSADLSIASQNVFTMFNNADIKFPVIKDETGNDIEITKGNYGRLMESSDRRVRKETFQGLYSSYTKFKNTLAATLGSSVKKNIFYTRVRKYPSALAASLDQDNISSEVYHNLIAIMHKNMDYMYRYMNLRRKMLGVDELHMYDIYTPLVKEFNMNVPYDKAKQMVVEGLKPLGEEYVSKLSAGMEAGWIDVYENEGKTSGAYSWGAYDTHPYVLMNYDNKLDDVFTLAHEMGHSMHTYYSNQVQPYIYSQYTIFLAEVASTVNESLLIDHLLKTSQNDQEKMYLINHYLEQFRGTVYRQTMFAEFEKIIHEKVEQGGALTPEELCSIYRDLNRQYYGPGVILDDEIDMEWARIPHFYSAFYVYKYATGFSAATAFKEQILNEGDSAVARYLEFLKAGSSDYPLSILKRAGVDLSTPEPVESALNYFGKLVTQLEEMAGL